MNLELWQWGLIIISLILMVALAVIRVKFHPHHSKAIDTWQALQQALSGERFTILQFFADT